MSGFQDDDRLSALETQIRAQFPAEEEVKILRRAVAYLLKSVSQLLPEAGLREMGQHPELEDFWSWHNTVEDILRGTPDSLKSSEAEEAGAVEAIHEEIARSLTEKKEK